ncbi:MAG: hypothetical protein IKC53_11080 [Lentisphaeria bacterium]|nr:hypothetical protein [Lentisphaeria bacterium]MBR3687587.1 hypothetical protein [Lentisphaeria bacterium]
MNRSILIVTCDFLVLAAMSLSIGMNEVGDPAGAAKISSPATRLVEMIDEELVRHEEVKQQKDELAQRLEEFRALALKDEKQIASQDEEIKQAQAKLAETLAALTKTKDEFASEKTKSAQELAKSAAELAKTKKDLDEREAALKRSAAVIEQKESELKISAQELIERDKVIRDSESLLETSERSLARVTQEKAAATEKLQQSERLLSRTSGQLELTKAELEALREQARLDRARAEEALAKFHAAEVELVETKSKLTSTQTQLNGMVRVLADVNSDLVKTKNELDKSEQSLAVSKETIAQNERLMSEKDRTIAQTETILTQKDKVIEDKDRDLNETKKKADELEKMLNNDVLTSYNASALELSFHLVNDRLFNNIVIDKSFFLPAVTLGGKTWLVSAFRDTTGLNLHSGYTKVTELQYKVRRPQSKDQWSAVNGPALCLAEDARVCLFPVDAAKTEAPVRVITFGALRERGLDNLTLFKSATFSKDSADITGRCSVSMEQGDNYLYIRNPNRSSSELKADVGDIVLSKEGFFVGVVVKVSSSDLGQTSTAQCYVFTGEPELTKALQLRLTKEPSQTLYYDFVDKHESLRKVTEQLDKSR